MSDDSTPTEAAREYAAAYAAHYSARDFATALQLYRTIIAGHASTREAEYSRAQVQNIVNAVVPRRELLDAQIELALAQLDAGLVARVPLASELDE